MSVLFLGDSLHLSQFYMDFNSISSIDFNV